MIILIAACSAGNVIGNGDVIPWHIPEDFAHFKRTTLGHAIVMGRKTWDTLPKKPLPKRSNIIISQSPMSVEGAECFATIGAAIAYAKSLGEDTYVIGGQSIYEQTIDLADRLVISHVNGEFEGDKFFPHFSLDHWVANPKQASEQFTVVEYTRRRG
jgi:dihydrofolate reductase